MKATGIVRRIDDLGRVVIPKEIRRTMRIREGDPLEIYTSKEGEVIFKKYSLLGDLDDYAAQMCETMNKSTGFTVAITDRDAVIAAAGVSRKELIGKTISEQLSQILEQRKIHQCEKGQPPLPVTEQNERHRVCVAAPVLSQGDTMGLVLFVAEDPDTQAGDAEYKLAQTIAAFLGKQMEA